MSRARLILEHAPSPQERTELAYHGGQLVIGRGDDADWRINDPEKFVSRKHFVLSEDDGGIVVTDASTGGLFVDGAATALGLGNSVRLENGMRLRFGEFVARVELEGAPRAAEPRPAPRATPAYAFDPVSQVPVRAERPRELPEPFGARAAGFFDRPERGTDRPVAPIDRDDPFALDLKPAAPRPAAAFPAPPAQGGGGYFDAQRAAPEPAAPVPPPAPFVLTPAAPPPASTPQVPLAMPVPPRAPQADEAALRAAFYRGLGIEPRPGADTDPLAEMEALGRRFRALTEGLVHLLRTRAEEKQKVRVAQTIIGAANVNPLKFAVGTDDAVAALAAARGPGYLDPDTAIAEAHRDLIDHQMRTWAAVQGALRQMIDRFDPDAIEREVEGTGRLEALIAGGRRARLWQLYQERYREIARAAEERFLGEIGADFRNAYETKGGSSR